MAKVLFNKGCIFLLLFALIGCQATVSNYSEKKLYLYKIMSRQDWADSQQLGYIKPQLNDTDFIHLSMQEQIDKIAMKFYANQPDIMIAKLEPEKFQGKLVYEKNPGGENKYYHLYNGKIPLDAVVDVAPYKQN